MNKYMHSKKLLVIYLILKCNWTSVFASSTEQNMTDCMSQTIDINPLTLLETRSPISGSWLAWFLLRPLSLACRWHFLTVSWHFLGTHIPGLFLPSWRHSPLLDCSPLSGAHLTLIASLKDFSVPGGSVVKNPPANAGDAAATPGSGRSPGERNGNSFQLSTLSCLTFCNSVDCSPPGSSILGILQARILEWVAMPFSRGSSQPRDRTRISFIAGYSLLSEPPGKPNLVIKQPQK